MMMNSHFVANRVRREIEKRAKGFMQQFVDIAMEALVRGDEHSSNAIIEAVKIVAKKNGFAMEVENGQVQRLYEGSRMGKNRGR